MGDRLVAIGLYVVAGFMDLVDEFYTYPPALKLIKSVVFTLAAMLTGFGLVRWMVKANFLPRQLKHESTRDFLTGLGNRAFLMENLEHSIARWKRSRVVFSLLVIDLDRFKQVNDLYGHQYGDRVLAEIGQRFVKELRNVDVVCRYGGDEFAIILDGTGAQEARNVAERLKSAV